MSDAPGKHPAATVPASTGNNDSNKDDKKSSTSSTSSSTAAADKTKNKEPQLSDQQQLIKRQCTHRAARDCVNRCAAFMLRSHIFMIRKGVVQHDPRLVTRVLRQLNAVRKRMTAPVLKALTKQYLPSFTQRIVDAQANMMTDATKEEEDLSPPTLPTATAATTTASSTSDKAKDNSSSSSTSSSSTSSDSSSDASKASSEAAKKQQAEQEEKERQERELLVAIVPEVDVYIQLLVALFFIDQHLTDEAADIVGALFNSLSGYNRRSLDTLSAKIYYYYALLNEGGGHEAEIRDSLLMAHRTACLQHNEPGQAALSVAILRSYLRDHLYAQADTFRLKSNFPDQRSNAQTARYCYYLGKIQAVQLHYSDAYASLTQALRKAPQKAAVGFRQVCTKLLILVQLLMGDIPERNLFSPKELRKSLSPYLALTQAVRVGDLAKFNDVMLKQRMVFERDGHYSLLMRLRSNVIKAGLRKINLAYSKISIKDICAKLNLENEEDAEYMVAKAIHDGVIEAVVDRDSGCLVSKEMADVYATHEPQQAYHKRIQFTMNIYQQAVKSLRYPNALKHRHVWESDDEDDEDVIAGNVPDKREADRKDEKKDS